MESFKKRTEKINKINGTENIESRVIELSV